MDATMYQWFDHFHRHPEVSWKEVETTATIVRILQRLGVSFQTFDDLTGVIAEIGEGERVIAVRADMDALWQEVDGVYQANHSCGHDAHITIVLGALQLLQQEPLGCRVRFIFQPAEEQGNGSVAMIERGALKDVTYLFGIHLRPQEELPFGKIAPAIQHGAAIFLNGKIKGIDAHGARPHQGKNALDPLFSIAQFIKTIQLTPSEVYSVKLTKVQAGGESLNIIPGTATFALDVRAQSNGVLNELRQRVEKGIQQIADLHDIPIEYRWMDYTPAAEVAAEAVCIAQEAIVEKRGDDALAPPIMTSGSDDFHFYTIHQPTVKATMLGLGADLTPGLHHPKMTFRRDILPIGAEVLALVLKKASFATE